MQKARRTGLWIQVCLVEIGQHLGHQLFDPAGADELVHGGHVHPELVVVLRKGDHGPYQLVDPAMDRGEPVRDAPKVDAVKRIEAALKRRAAAEQKKTAPAKKKAAPAKKAAAKPAKKKAAKPEK